MQEHAVEPKFTQPNAHTRQCISWQVLCRDTTGMRDRKHAMLAPTYFLPSGDVQSIDDCNKTSVYFLQLSRKHKLSESGTSCAAKNQASHSVHNQVCHTSAQQHKLTCKIHLCHANNNGRAEQTICTRIPLTKLCTGYRIMCLAPCHRQLWQTEPERGRENAHQDRMHTL